MIPPEYKEQIVQNGISFMRSITEAYGAEEGMRLWETIAGALDPDVKGQIFFAMLTGNFSGRILITGIRHTAYYPNNTSGLNKVSMIKALRAATGWGLKESKDAIDDLVASGRHILVECAHEHRQRHCHDLRAAGLAC